MSCRGNQPNVKNSECTFVISQKGTAKRRRRSFTARAWHQTPSLSTRTFLIVFLRERRILWDDRHSW